MTTAPEHSGKSVRVRTLLPEIDLQGKASANAAFGLSSIRCSRSSRADRYVPIIKLTSLSANCPLRTRPLSAIRTALARGAKYSGRHQSHRGKAPINLGDL